MTVPRLLQRLSQALLPLAHGALAPRTVRRAAVLVLFYPRDEQITFALTVRPDTLSRHPGQISLPGGMAEPYDATLWDTAVRETEEELGLSPHALIPLGRLDDVTMRNGESVITPFVGWQQTPPQFRPDRNEVADVLEVPIHTLLQPASIEEETWELRGRQWRVAYYRLSDRMVWGITGLILSDLHDRLEAGTRAVRPGSVRPLA